MTLCSRSNVSKDETRSGESAAQQKKDKVLQARIPDTLDSEIKKRATNLGISVSTVVRNVLMHTFDLVEDIVADGTNVALSVAGEKDAKTEPRTSRGDRSGRKDRSERSPDDPNQIIGWQRAVLNLNAVCERCNTILKKGGDAAIAIRDRPDTKTILCPDCLAIVTTDDGK